MARSLNKVQLIGNLTRDPELRETPQGAKLCTFTVATDRKWNINGVEKEEVDFHKCVAWEKLAELCNSLLAKGKKVYVDGRLSNKKVTKDGVDKYYTEIVVSDMIVLDKAPTTETQE